jgi:ribonuclease P protein component
LGAKTLPNGLAISRFGIIVSAKISKKAAIRNKIKRQIREIIRLQLQNIKSGQDNAIIVLAPIISENYQTIEKELNQIFKRLRLYK